MRKAFTLAEVLLTLVIIGVVAAITVPTVMTNASEQERITRSKKGFSTLANAMIMVKAAGGDYIFDVKNDSDANMKSWFDTYLKPYLNTLKVCYNEKGCWHEDDTRNLNGTNVYYNRKGVGIGANIITAILADGTFINIDSYGSASMGKYFGVDLGVKVNADYGLVVFYDINGTRKPNMVGRDIFVTVFTDDGLVPAYRDRTPAKIKADCSSSGTGYSCLRRYLGKH